MNIQHEYLIQKTTEIIQNNCNENSYCASTLMDTDDCLYLCICDISNYTLKWLKNSRFYGNIDKIFYVSLSKLQPRKKAQMGNPLMVKN